jgi:hypothetical protein
LAIPISKTLSFQNLIPRAEDFYWWYNAPSATNVEMLIDMSFELAIKK